MNWGQAFQNWNEVLANRFIQNERLRQQQIENDREQRRLELLEQQQGEVAKQRAYDRVMTLIKNAPEGATVGQETMDKLVKPSELQDLFTPAEARPAVPGSLASKSFTGIEGLPSLIQTQAEGGLPGPAQRPPNPNFWMRITENPAVEPQAAVPPGRFNVPRALDTRIQIQQMKDQAAMARLQETNELRRQIANERANLQREIAQGVHADRAAAISARWAELDQADRELNTRAQYWTAQIGQEAARTQMTGAGIERRPQDIFSLGQPQKPLPAVPAPALITPPPRRGVGPTAPAAPTPQAGPVSAKTITEAELVAIAKARNQTVDQARAQVTSEGYTIVPK